MRTENIYCDRCKKIIKEECWNNFGYHIYKRKFLIHRITDNEIMDLCQDCYNSLKDWVKNKENK